MEGGFRKQLQLDKPWHGWSLAGEDHHWGGGVPIGTGDRMKEKMTICTISVGDCNMTISWCLLAEMVRK